MAAISPFAPDPVSEALEAGLRALPPGAFRPAPTPLRTLAEVARMAAEYPDDQSLATVAERARGCLVAVEAVDAALRAVEAQAGTLALREAELFAQPAADLDALVAAHAPLRAELAALATRRGTLSTYRKAQAGLAGPALDDFEAVHRVVDLHALNERWQAWQERYRALQEGRVAAVKAGFNRYGPEEQARGGANLPLIGAEDNVAYLAAADQLEAEASALEFWRSRYLGQPGVWPLPGPATVDRLSVERVLHGLIMSGDLAR
jgi:hypothetical protein